jgi:predicted transcriptional regulator
MSAEGQSSLVLLTVDIVSAFVAHNKIAQNDLGLIIEEVHRALVRAPAAAAEPEKIELVPAVSIKRSVTPDYIVSLEDGKKFKSMKRYLMRAHGLTPDEYRAKWGLPRDYPMVAPNYAKARSDLARKMGLGRKSDVGSAAKKARRSRKRAGK